MAWNLIVQAVWMYALSEAARQIFSSASGEKLKAASLNEFDMVRANEGDPIPLIYGTCRMRSPSLVWYGEFSPTTALSSSGVPNGFKYRIAFRFILGLGNAGLTDSTGATFVRLYIGDKALTPLDSDFIDGAGPAVSTHAYGEDDLFGGNDAGGGVEGCLTFYGGTWLQQRMTYDIGDSEEPSHTPAHRGQIVVTLRGLGTVGESAVQAGGWWVGNSTSLPSYSFVVNNPVYIPTYEGVSGAIGDGDANPAAVLYDLLVNPWGRTGTDDDLVGPIASIDEIDVVSFGAAAAILQTEQNGISLTISSTIDCRSAIEQILRQIDAHLFVDPSTRKYVLKLIREDYNVGTIPVFGPSEVVAAPEMSTTLWEEAVNEVRVVFTDASKAFNDGVAVEQDTSLIAAQGGRRRSAELRFPGVSNSALAQRIAARELNLMARPIAKVTLKLNRSAHSLRPGDAFLFEWPDWNNLSMVCRVGEIEMGTLEDGTITVGAIQDRFTASGTGFDGPNDAVGPSAITPIPIQLRHITEAPRWAQVKAYNAGAITSVDAQHSYSLAIPKDPDLLYQMRKGVDGAATAADLSAIGFHGNALVDLAYSRTAEPYDISTGLRVRAMSGVTLTSATASQIAQGANLICVGSGDSAEFMAFENFSDLGGGDYLLINIWRGLLDTAPVAHADGEPVWFVGASYNMIGSSTLTYGTAIATRTQASAGSSWTAEENSPYDAFAVRQRTLLPYPPADLLLQGVLDGSATKTPVAMQEEVLNVDWKTRNRTTATIIRGDAADETIEGGATHAIVAYKDGRDPVDIIIGLTGSASTGPSLSKAGHGTIEVGIESRRTVTLPSGATPELGSWTVPKVPIVAHHWRNLLRNSRFNSPIVSGTNFWTTVTGDPDTSTGTQLGGAGAVLIDGGSLGLGVNIYQDVDISGYDPIGLRALFQWYDTTISAYETLTVTLTSRNAGGTVLQTTTYGPTVPDSTNWLGHAISIDGLHADTVSVRAAIVMTVVGDPAIASTIKLTECALRVGQITEQLLSDASFETGSAAWTVSSGTWAATTSQKYEGFYGYHCSSDVATAEAYQQVAATAGYEGAAVAVLEFSQVNTAANDTGEVILEARSSGGTVLATATTGAITTTTNVWQRKRLTVELPTAFTVATIRVRLVGTRVGGANIDVIWDDFDLRIHKHLDPDADIDVSFETPTTQALPRTTEEWRYRFPNVTPPDYAIFDGGIVGRLGTEALLTADTGVLVNGTAVVRMPSDDGMSNATTSCYENPVRQSTADVHANAIGTTFANFETGLSFTALAFIKVNEQPFSGVACGVMGRVAAGVGWTMGLTSAGYPQVSLVGATATATATLPPTVPVVGGGLHGVALAYDAAGADLYAVSGAESATVATTGIGEIYSTTPGRFRMFRAIDGGAAMPGQIVRAYLWSSFVPVADLQSVMGYATDPTGELDTNARIGSISVVTDVNSTGALVETFSTRQVAIGYHEASERHYLVAAPAIVNLAPASFEDTDWTEVGTSTTAWDAATDPSGYRQAVAVTSVSGEGARLNAIALGAAGDVTVAWFARATTAHDARIRLENASGTSLATLVYSVTTVWKLFTWTTSAWDGSTSGVGRLIWSGVDTGAAGLIYLSPIVLVAKDSKWRGVIPVGSPTATTHSCTMTLDAQWNSEGELEAEVWNADVNGTIIDLSNSGSSVDRRQVRWDTGTGAGDVIFDHRNSGGTNAAGTVTDTTIDPSTPWIARARWCRAILPDLATPTGFTTMRVEQGATVEVANGRTATWTQATTAPNLVRLGYDGSTDILSGGIFRFRLSTREKKIG